MQNRNDHRQDQVIERLRGTLSTVQEPSLRLFVGHQVVGIQLLECQINANELALPLSAVFLWWSLLCGFGQLQRKAANCLSDITRLDGGRERDPAE